MARIQWIHGAALSGGVFRSRGNAHHLSARGFPRPERGWDLKVEFLGGAPGAMALV